MKQRTRETCEALDMTYHSGIRYIYRSPASPSPTCVRRRRLFEKQFRVATQAISSALFSGWNMLVLRERGNTATIVSARLHARAVRQHAVVVIEEDGQDHRAALALENAARNALQLLVGVR